MNNNNNIVIIDKEYRDCIWCDFSLKVSVNNYSFKLWKH